MNVIKDKSVFAPSIRKSAKSLFNRFRGNKEGVVSIEFALIMPVLVAIFLSTLELANYVMIDRRAGFANEYYAAIMSRSATRVYSRQMYHGESVFPIVNTTASPRYRLSPSFWARRSHEMAIASVDMVRQDPNCVGNACAFQPVVLWKYDRAYYLGGQLAKFTCNMEVTTGYIGPEEDKIDASFVGRSPVFMSRLAYEYHPIALKGIIPTRFHKKSATMQVRSDVPLRHYAEGFYCPGQYTG